MHATSSAPGLVTRSRSAPHPMRCVARSSEDSRLSPRRSWRAPSVASIPVMAKGYPTRAIPGLWMAAGRLAGKGRWSRRLPGTCRYGRRSSPGRTRVRWCSSIANQGPRRYRCSGARSAFPRAQRLYASSGARFSGNVQRLLQGLLGARSRGGHAQDSEHGYALTRVGRPCDPQGIP